MTSCENHEYIAQAPIDHSRTTITYHNALCLSPQNFAYALSSVSLGAILTPKRNWRQCVCKILGWQTKSIMVCFGIFWSGQFKSRPYESELAETAYLIRLEKFLPGAVKQQKKIHLRWADSLLVRRRRASIMKSYVEKRRDLQQCKEKKSQFPQICNPSLFEIV